MNDSRKNRWSCVDWDTMGQQVRFSFESQLLREVGERAQPATVLLVAWAAITMRQHDVGQVVVARDDGRSSDTVDHIALRLEGDDSLADLIRRLPSSHDGVVPSTDDELLRVGFIEEGTAQRDGLTDDLAVALRWSINGERVQAFIDYDPAQIDPARAAAMADQLQRLLMTAAADSDARIVDFCLLTDEERAALDKWNSTDHPHDAERPLIALFDAQVQRTPDAPAVEMDGSTTSYQTLKDRADAVAQALTEGGVGPGSAVALCVERSLGMAVGMLAILRTGAAYVPIDPAYPRQRQSYMIDDCGAGVILTDARNADQIAPAAQVKMIVLEELSVPDVLDAQTLGDPTGSDGGYVIYTSGSTGQPKGVWMPQRALTNLIEWQLRRPQATPTPRTLQFSALSFDVSFQEIYSTWAAGGTLVLISDSARRDSDSLLDSLIDNRIQRLFLPFVALRALAQTAVRTGRFPLGLREVYTAGEQLQVDKAVRGFFAALPGCVLENHYGPSESHVASAHTLPGDPSSWPTLPSIGGPIANTQLFVLDRWGQFRPIGATGELYIAGTCLADGYLNKPEMTAERFLAASGGPPSLPRRYRTGDLVRWLPDGELEFLGRADGQVKLRGFRVEPGEVTAVLSSAPGVAHSVAMVRDDVAGNTARMVGYVVPDDVATFQLRDVKAYAADRLPDHMVPSHWSVLDDLPLTPSGKLDTRSLPVPTFDREVLSEAYQAPEGHVQLALASIWNELLGLDDVGVHDDFFDLGGDSLLAVEMMTMIHDRLGLDLPLGALAQARTIADLDAIITGDPSSVWRSLVPLRVEGDRVPLFVVHGGSGNVGNFPKLAAALSSQQPVYALQWDGLDGGRGSRSIEAMASTYLDEVKSVQPHGPYRLAGQCIGGLVAQEMARQLTEEGEPVDLVVMYDSPNLASPAYSARRAPFVIFQIKRTLMGGSRRQEMRVYLRSRLRRPIAPQDRRVYGRLALVRAAWRYRAKTGQVAAPTMYIGTGISNAARIALVGFWDDGAMGWAHRAAADFTIERIDAGHNEVPYHPDALASVERALRS